MRTLLPVLVVSLLAVAKGQAQESEASLEHTGSVGLLFGMGPEYSVSVVAPSIFGAAERTIAEYSAALEVGATMAIGENGSELVLRGRLVFLSAARGGSVLFGYRKYFGRDQVKTYASFDLQGTFRPVKTLGARAGFGVMYDFSPLLGVYAEPGATFGLGNGRRFGAEILAGFQARSFLLQ